MIEIDNISVTYKSGERKILALSSVNLTIEDGEFLSVLGPNGSGKSTLVKALCGLVEFDEGSIMINGSEVFPGKFSDTLFGKIGVVFQEPSGQFLMPSVRKEIEAVLENLGLDYPRQIERFEEIVDKFQLDRILHIPPDKLSPGQMQIVNLAVAFTVGSEVLILDEPTTFLDLSGASMTKGEPLSILPSIPMKLCVPERPASWIPALPLLWGNPAKYYRMKSS